MLVGADLYVTLEPCCHFGKTPPCTDIIIEKNIKRVIIGAQDPNPLVKGKGIEKLKIAGIDVVQGVLENECLEANEIFFHYIKNNCILQGNKKSRYEKYRQSREKIYMKGIAPEHLVGHPDNCTE